MTISRTKLFTSQPVRMNSVASQSSNSGCEGHSPRVPKSSLVFTRPVPKNCCQNRFTVTRAVSGCVGSTSQRANVSRLVTSPCGSGGSTDGTPGPDRFAVLVVLTADEQPGRPRLFQLLRDHRRRDFLVQRLALFSDRAGSRHGPPATLGSLRRKRWRGSIRARRCCSAASRFADSFLSAALIVVRSLRLALRMRAPILPTRAARERGFWAGIVMASEARLVPEGRAIEHA